MLHSSRQTAEPALLLIALALAAVLMVARASEANKFVVQWNAPTFMCHKYGIFFNLSQYNIVQNVNDEFVGDKMVIIYDPGFFPILQNGKRRNGGVPQEGNLTKHLYFLRKDIDLKVPDPDFKGKIYFLNFYLLCLCVITDNIC